MPLELGTDRADAVVDRADHCRVALHVAGEHGLLVCGERVPGGDVLAGLGVARWELGAGWHDAELDLAGQAAFADRVPTGVVHAAHRLDVGALGVQRGVNGTVGVVQEERLGRVSGLDLADHPHRPIGEVVGEVVPVGVLLGVDDRVALIHAMGMVEAGQRFEEPVVLLEPSLQRP